MFKMLTDCTVIYFDGDFKKRLLEQKKLENEMIKRFGRNQPKDFRYKVSVGENCIYAEHVSENYLKEKAEYVLN